MPLEIALLPALQDNYIHLLHDPVTHQTAVVDPTFAAPVLDYLNARQWQLNAIFCTHHHGDHVGGNAELRERTGCQVYGFSEDAHRIPAISHELQQGEEVKIGESAFKVIHIPGHTLGHIAYWSEREKLVFTGDTLFSLGCGRLFEGTAEQMHRSLGQLAALPGETEVYCGHEYTQANGRFALTVEPFNTALQRRILQVADLRKKGLPTLPSTIGMEKETNPFLRVNSPEIVAALELEEASEVERFAALRSRKDRF